MDFPLRMSDHSDHGNSHETDQMLLDNKASGRVGDVLRTHLGSGKQMSAMTSCFTVFGFDALRAELSRGVRLRLLLTAPDAVLPKSLAGTDAEAGLRSQLRLQWIARECANWIRANAELRSLSVTVAQNLYIVTDGQKEEMVVSGTSEFNADGLGAVRSSALSMSTLSRDPDLMRQLRQWYDSIWNDPTASKNSKEQMLDGLDFLASPKPPSFLYFLTLFNLFKDIIDEIDEERIIKSKTGFKDTIVWNKLYKFQKDGVLGAIDKLERYNGCIIADSVGLGKTFEALAVIKYYELRNDRVLVLAPKKLRENWSIYTANDKRNLLAADRFNFDVLNHTDLSRDGGLSGDINLSTINWGNYDLVVIDESHNFRNNNPSKDKVTRYQRLMDEVIRKGVKTKVLMLSATPVNNRLNDLKNQVAFITEGKDKALADVGIQSIDVTLRRAQTQFNNWLKLPPEGRTTASLLEGLNFGYFKLLDLLTIARSRRHIERYYDTAEIGKFPERLKPQNVKSDIDKDAVFPPLKDINRSIKKLSLAAYAPLDYLRADRQEDYSRKYDHQVQGGKSTLKQVDRERSLIHLMRVNMLKRMESSIHSFALTVGKIHDQVGALLSKLDAHDAAEIEELIIDEIESDSPELEDMMIGRKVKVLIQDIDTVRMRQDLQADHALLGYLLEEARRVDAQDDAKLQKLKDTIATKLKNPINAGNRKVIVFTAFSDTAEYLFKHVSTWAQKEYSLHSALVTGSGTNRCTLDLPHRDLNGILTNFSPISKERAKIDPSASTEIDILIATDCISEGQNLQDCDMLINYDIHWNPVRIIQRFGRIDRLGSKNAAIQLTNFWPNMELDEYINLEARVSGRMVLLDISATGEENVIDYDENRQMNDLEYRRKQMKQLQDAVVDLEDIDGSVSITDMTLNDFRMDLSNFMKEGLPLLEVSPAGFQAVVSPNTPEAQAGVIFCLRDIKGKVRNDDSYALAPYYLVYVAETGSVVFNHLQAKKSLDIYKKLAATVTELDKAGIEAVGLKTKNGRDMDAFIDLRNRAIESIVGKTEEKGVESLFARGGTAMTQDHFRGGDDFEVVSFLIIHAP